MGGFGAKRPKSTGRTPGLRLLFGGSYLVCCKFGTQGADRGALTNTLLTNTVGAGGIAGILRHLDLQSGLGK